ncbi:hypothetical protein [Salsuginibacillus kocurii]|uniref:hypothetical protein n=1 Tax=Salsuginibacillus kocurii TaxID=427078 RepID=UPI00036DF299|nr:hypothetical protein [Salsuginibacillus kocurii]
METAALKDELEKRGMEEVLELMEEAEKEELAELELVESLGLLRDETLNEAVLTYLKSLGVEIIYVDDETVDE